MNLSRRGFLGSIIAAAVAPAIIRTPGLLMPIKPALLNAHDDPIMRLIMEKLRRSQELAVEMIASEFLMAGTNEVVRLGADGRYRRVPMRYTSLFADAVA